MLSGDEYMYNIDPDGWQELLLYSDIYSGPLPEIDNEIKEIETGKLISIICELIAVRNSTVDTGYLKLPYQMVIKRDICGIKVGSVQELFSDTRLMKNRHIISLQTLLVLLKYAIKNTDGDVRNVQAYEVTKEDYLKVVKLGLLVAQKMSEKDAENSFSVSNFIYGTYHINNDHNVASAIVRSYYLLNYLDRNKDIFPADVINEYRDYWNDFQNKYGYTILDYLFTIFRILELYYGGNRYLSYQSFWLDLDVCYGNTAIKNTAKKVIADLGCTIENIKKWAIETIDEFWNFRGFLENPFICSTDGNYIAISDFTTKNIFFENLFWKIRNCYPVSDNRAMAFYGRLFERYIQDQVEEIVNSHDDYQYIPEFTYGRNNSKSSDAYIKSGNKLLAIEAKGFSVYFDCLQNKMVSKNLNKLFIKPILQADKAFFNNASRPDFSHVKELYILSVTMDSINAVPDYINNCVTEVEKNKKSKILKGYYNISIEELEMFLSILENGEDIFGLLEAFLSSNEIMPFSNYLSNQSKCDIKMTSFMSRIFEEYADKMRKTYWPSE